MNTLLDAYKILQVADAGISIAKVVKDKNATTTDKVAAVLHGVFAGAQIGDFIAVHAGLNPQIRFCTALSTGITDMCRLGVATYGSKDRRKLTYVDISKIALHGAGLFFFRFDDIVDVASAISTDPLQIGECTQLSQIDEWTSSLVKAASAVISLPQSLKDAWSSFLLYRAKRPRDGCPMVEMTLFSKKSINKELSDLFNYAARIKDLSRIPDCIVDDPRLTFICPITERPIRYILILRLREQESNRTLLKVMYEREAIKKWIKEKPNEAPPGWPTAHRPLPLRSDYFTVYHLGQSYINRTLREIIRELQTYYLNTVALPLPKKEENKKRS